MSDKDTLEEAIENTTAVAAVLTMAPVLGAVGTLSAVGFAVSAVVGGGFALFSDDD